MLKVQFYFQVEVYIPYSLLLFLIFLLKLNDFK